MFVPGTSGRAGKVGALEYFSLVRILDCMFSHKSPLLSNNIGGVARARQGSRTAKKHLCKYEINMLGDFAHHEQRNIAKSYFRTLRRNGTKK